MFSIFYSISNGASKEVQFFYSKASLASFVRMNVFSWQWLLKGVIVYA